MSAPTRYFDGAYPAEHLVRKATRSPPPPEEPCVIFVHAGAGYHSHQNERIHLEACNDSAAIGMCIMKNAGSSVDAVEAAIKLLEDREITNAGYGSNLAMDGVVECDASIVDHFGRSGAVGAVAQIKNPISLARLVYEHTSKPLTLRRVPPNLLCAQGATEFAVEQGMPIVPHDCLVSDAAKERWIRWRGDLRNAEKKAKRAGQHPSCYKLRVDVSPDDEVLQTQIRQRHTDALLRQHPSLLESPSPKPYEESLYYSTENTSSIPSEPTAQSGLSSGLWFSDDRIPSPDTAGPPPVPAELGPSSIAESSRSAFNNSTQKAPTLGQFRTNQPTMSEQIVQDDEMEGVPRLEPSGPLTRKNWGDGSGEESDSTSTATVHPLKRKVPPASVDDEVLGLLDGPLDEELSTRVKDTVEYTKQDNPWIPVPSRQKPKTGDPLPTPGDKKDHITDTVGVIAIDRWGRIACGASSGGIGMKYRGRVGPAALVGVGAAVVPLDTDDSEQASVATVTSGTGEHMATTMAATTCAERLYQSVKKEKGGEYAEVTEDEALRAMIENEFMGHASVRNSNSAGAIGILGVKKTRHGVSLFYGHNTDSFAMASMSSEDDVPKCTMSRSNGNGQIAQGGRMMSYKTRKRAKVVPRQRQVG